MKYDIGKGPPLRVLRDPESVSDRQPRLTRKQKLIVAGVGTVLTFTAYAGYALNDIVNKQGNIDAGKASQQPRIKALESQSRDAESQLKAKDAQRDRFQQITASLYEKGLTQNLYPYSDSNDNASVLLHLLPDNSIQAHYGPSETCFVNVNVTADASLVWTEDAGKNESAMYVVSRDYSNFALQAIATAKNCR